MKRFRIWSYAASVCCIVYLFGCTAVGFYNPNPKIAAGVKSIEKSSVSVCLINDQPNSDRHLLDFQKIEVDYNAFTQSLVDAMKAEFERCGAKVSTDSEKKLYIKVALVQMANLGAVYRAKIKAYVKTGDGDQKMFLSSRASYASPFNMATAPTRPLDAAFKDLVVKIMSDPTLQAYFRT